MKEQGHPKYQEVLFVDSSTGTKFICGSTLQPKERESFEGKEYPLYRLPISSASHPFFTGSKQHADSEGRIDKFNKRYAQKREQAVLAAQVVKKEEPKKKRAPKKTA